MDSWERLNLNTTFKELAVELDRLGLKWAVAGGWCRDVTHYKEPKDIDIIVADWDYISKGQLRELDDFTRKNLSTDHSNSDYTYRGGRIEKVLTLKDGIDIIFWSAKYKTVFDIVKDFDFNINQYILSRDGDIKFLGCNKGTLQITVAKLRELSVPRAIKIRGKAEDIGWDISEEVHSIIVEHSDCKPSKPREKLLNNTPFSNCPL